MPPRDHKEAGYYGGHGGGVVELMFASMWNSKVVVSQDLLVDWTSILNTKVFAVHKYLVASNYRSRVPTEQHLANGDIKSFRQFPTDTSST